MNKKANQLVYETSPYLLQHAYNPVDWHPWNNDTLQKAKNENKLLIISVGYSACHWCHVMEHQSFEDEEVARWMNGYYVPVKVDREERPDVDQVYMQAAYLTSGRGGWPLNVIALPDGRPVFGGTYFPKENWIKVLQYFAAMFRNESEKLQQQAVHLTDGINKMDDISGRNEQGAATIRETLDKGTAALYRTIDMEWGGKGNAPKFMMPNIWEYMLTRHVLEQDDFAAKATYLTLDKMALGGLYDQLQGGFTRYSTDIYWKVPHFEKMLYDNGQLISLYAHAYQLTGNPLYKRVLEQTIDFCEIEWRSPEGGFYSAYDADSEGEEGKYYTWTVDEIGLALGEDAPAFMQLYTMSGSGNWEHGINILHRLWQDEAAANTLKIEEAIFRKWLDNCHHKLLAIMQKRVKPGLDNKQLAGWNALMLKGLCDAYSALGDPAILEKALRTARFLQAHLQKPDGSMFRNFCQGKATIDAFLDDYALVTEAYIALYQVTFDEQWIHAAVQLTTVVTARFCDDTFFYFTPADANPLISRPRELSDNVISASNSVIAHNLWQLGWLMDKPEWRSRAEAMCKAILPEISQQTAFYANWARLTQLMLHEPIQVAIVGNEAEQWRKILQSCFRPNVLWMGITTGDTNIPLLKDKHPANRLTSAYICKGFTCGMPVIHTDDLVAQL
jgi:uncharacterized protein